MGIVSKVKDWPVSQSLSNYSVSVRTIFAVMLALGVVSLIIGWQTDIRPTDWSASLGFLTNIWAALTGFLLGVPFALVVLSTVTRQSEDKAASDRVEKLTQVAWSEFRSVVYKYASDERLEALRIWAPETHKMCSAFVSAFNTYRATATAEDDPNQRPGIKMPLVSTTDEEFARLQTTIAEIMPVWTKAFVSVSSCTDERDLQLTWSEIQSNWGTLDQFVRLQRMERGLPWFGSDVNADIRNQLLPNENMLVHFLDDDRTMKWQFQSALDWAKYDKVTINARLAETWYRSPKGFPLEESTFYSRLASAAVTDLLNLRRVIEAVEGSSWPGAAST